MHGGRFACVGCGPVRWHIFLQVAAGAGQHQLHLLDAYRRTLRSVCKWLQRLWFKASSITLALCLHAAWKCNGLHAQARCQTIGISVMFFEKHRFKKSTSC